MPKVTDVIKEQFYLWNTYKDILKAIEVQCGIKRSLSWLKLKLRVLGLKRRKSDMNLTVVKSLILKILETSEKLKGYRATVYGNCYVTNIIALFEEILL